MKSFKKRVFEIIEPTKGDDTPSLIFDYSIITLIILNVFSVILESFHQLKNSYALFFFSFELLSVGIFTVEYALRLWTSNYKFPHDNTLKSRVKYFFSFLALIDLMAILPFYLPMIIAIDLRFLRILRLTRLLRIFKIHRYTESLNLLSTVLKRKREELLVTLFITSLLLLLASSIMYYIESDVQPDAFPNILASFWWGIATLTTVGYGDVYPVTGLGKLLSGIIALLGIGLVALPTGIISAGFIEEMNVKKQSKTQEKDGKKYCPYCGKKLDE